AGAPQLRQSFRIDVGLEQADVDDRVVRLPLAVLDERHLVVPAPRPPARYRNSDATFAVDFLLVQHRPHALPRQVAKCQDRTLAFLRVGLLGFLRRRLPRGAGIIPRGAPDSRPRFGRGPRLRGYPAESASGNPGRISALGASAPPHSTKLQDLCSVPR